MKLLTSSPYRMYLLSLAARAAPLPGLTSTKTPLACTKHLANSRHRPCAVTNTCNSTWLTPFPCCLVTAAGQAVTAAFAHADCYKELMTYRVKSHARLQLCTVICRLQQTTMLSRLTADELCGDSMPSFLAADRPSMLKGACSDMHIPVRAEM